MSFPHQPWRTRPSAFAMLVLALLTASVACLGAPSEDSNATVAQISAAIKASGAKWVAGITDPMGLPASALCGLKDEGPAVKSGLVPTGKDRVGDSPIPAFWDWRNKDGHDWTTHIQNQGGCGSCFVFAACAASEAAMKIQSGPNGWQASPDFSEQFLLSCVGFSCDGGTTPGVYDYLVASGVPPDDCFPYTGNDAEPCSDRCPDWQNRIMKIAGWERVAGSDVHTIEQVKQAIMTYGPVSTGFDVYTDFKSYSGGVYEYSWGVLEGAHAVIIVGWDDSQECWIAKNSWGTNWGETKDFQPFTRNAGDGGWFRIKWGQSWFGTCAKYALATLPNLTDNKPTGWSYSAVPRNTTGATQTSCALTPTLPGNSTATYLNYSVINESGPAAPTFHIASLIDGVEVDETQVDSLPAATASYTNNVGPVLVRGGRHTYGILIDSDNDVPEVDESITESPFDNIACRQFVWSPLGLGSGGSLARYSPPVKDAWGDTLSPRYYNCDGFSFDVAPSAWSAVAILSSDSTGHYDMKLWGIGDYQGSTTGFGPGALKNSVSGGSLCDFVVVNGRQAPSGTYYAGVINDDGGTVDYRIEHQRSVPLYARPGTEWNGPYTSIAQNIIDVYDVFLTPGDYGININQLTGDCSLCMALYDAAGQVFDRSEYLPGALVQNSLHGDKQISFSIPTQGNYGLAVFKYNSVGWEKATSYRLAVSKKDIYVISPNGGETLGLGESCPIVWERFGDTGSLVKIDITRNGGFDWTTIADNVPNTGVYNWTVSGKVSYYAKIRVTSKSGNYGDVSDATFSIVSRSISVTSPNGGESWTHGTSHNITWSSSNVTGNVKIELSRDSGVHWETILASTANDGSQPWTATLPGSTHCRVRVSSVDSPSCSDTSNANFTIVGPSINLTYPIGGETWGGGDLETIAWTSANLSGSVKIQLSRDDGSTWETLSPDAPDTGSFEWTVSGASSADCRVKVVSNSYPEAADTSDAAFTIATRSIHVMLPSAGDTWQIGSYCPVRWTGEGLEGPVKIEVSLDNRSTWTTLSETATTEPTGGLATVKAIGPPSYSSYIRVTCIDHPTMSDTNDSAFHVSGKWIGLEAPNGGETWFAGDRNYVTWLTSGMSGMCGIELSTDSGATWQTLVGNWPVVQCQWGWNVTDVNSTHCRIKVTSYDYPETYSASSADFTIGRREIHVTSPVGGEKWCIGSTKEIGWTSSNVDGDVSIRLVDPNSGNYNTIVPSTPNDGSYSWPVTQMGLQDYRVAVVSNTYSSARGESAGPVSIVSSAMTVVSPNGGEVITRGATVDITWESCSAPAGNVRIEISRDSGATWADVVASTPNDGSESWVSTSPSSTQCRFRISSVADPGFSDISDADFQIITRSLRVSDPNGGEVWEIGTTHNITWQRSNCPGNVKIELSRNAGVLWQTIVASTSAAGSYPWTVTSPVSVKGLVRITSLDYPAITDSSNSSFTITDAGITVLTPAPGAALTVGATENITWSSRNLPAGNVKIELSRDSGSTWTTLYADTANSGTKPWTVTGAASTHCLMRVTSLADTSISDVTDGEFSIVSRSIELLSPVGGETWGIDERRTIAWRSGNVGGTVKIELTRDRWNTSEVLKPDADSTGEYDWNVTGPPSADCLVRVSSNNYPSVADESEDLFTVVEPVTVPIRLTLEDWVPSTSGKRVEVEVFSPGGSKALETHTLVLDYAGHCSFYTTLVGQRDLRFHARPWLAKRVGVNITPGMSHVLATLVNGDCNGDNAVDGADLDVVTANWNSDSFTNEYADLNGDGRCNAFDLVAIRRNWRVPGDRSPLGEQDASSPVMWFGDATGANLDTIEVAAGEPFDVYVWLTTTSNTWFADAAVAFSTTSVEGSKAFPDDNLIELAAGSPASDLAWQDGLSKYPLALSRTLGGFYKQSGGVRPYGADFACASIENDVLPFARLKLARLSLRHRMEPGDSAQISLWEDGTGTAGSLDTMLFGSAPIYGMSDTLTVNSYLADTIVEAKAGPDKDEVWLKAVPVTASFPGIFYIESPDRSIGIRVDKPAHGVPAGVAVDVNGDVYTSASGERYILAKSVDVGGSFPLTPVGITNRDMGGGDWLYNDITGAGQRGVAGGSGTNNIGLLVRTWGRIIAIDTAHPATWMRIDDGSGASVMCLVPSGVTINPGWQFVGVTGISACEKKGDDIYRLLLVRQQGDITPL